MTDIIKPEQVPKEVIDAAYDAYWHQKPNSGFAEAIAAALNACPGVHIHEWQRPWLGGMSGTDLIIPLTGNPDAE